MDDLVRLVRELAHDLMQETDPGRRQRLYEQLLDARDHLRALIDMGLALQEDDTDV